MLKTSYVLHLSPAIVVPFCQLKTNRLVLSLKPSNSGLFRHTFALLWFSTRGNYRPGEGKKYSTFPNLLRFSVDFWRSLAPAWRVVFHARQQTVAIRTHGASPETDEPGCTC